MLFTTLHSYPTQMSPNSMEQLRNISQRKSSINAKIKLHPMATPSGPSIVSFQINQRIKQVFSLLIQLVIKLTNLSLNLSSRTRHSNTLPPENCISPSRTHSSRMFVPILRSVSQYSAEISINIASIPRLTQEINSPRNSCKLSANNPLSIIHTNKISAQYTMKK